MSQPSMNLEPVKPFARPLHPSWLALLTICLMGAGTGALLGGGRALAGAALGLGMVTGVAAVERGRRLAAGVTTESAVDVG